MVQGGMIVNSKTRMYTYRIQKFVDKHKNRLLHMKAKYLTLQGKDTEIMIFYSGRVLINHKKEKFLFDENKIEELL
jgi:hypothetical protein